MFTNIATSHVADDCQPEGYRVVVAAAEHKHDITWLVNE